MLLVAVAVALVAVSVALGCGCRCLSCCHPRRGSASVFVAVAFSLFISSFAEPNPRRVVFVRWDGGAVAFLLEKIPPKDLLAFIVLTSFFFKNSPGIACQVPKPPENPPTCT